MIAVPHNYFSADDYLQWEEQQEEKHEYVDGKVYAMAGASEDHIDITTNLTVILSNHLRGKDCKLFPSDMRLNIASKKIYYYPDLLVTCDERDRFNKKQKNYPCLIIEVLSESTESKDRGVKFANYQTIQSLQEYVLISQWEQRIEVFRRNAKFWVLQTYTAGELIELQSINLQISMDAIYEDVALSEPALETTLEANIEE
jgi:Uma2 family endonuclease